MAPLPSLECIMRRVPGVQYTQRIGDVLRIFAMCPSTNAVAVLSGDIPIGVIFREMVADVVGLPCYREWIERESCAQFVSHPPYTLCIRADAAELVRALVPASHRHPAEPLVVTGNGAYIGIVERQALRRALMAMGLVSGESASPSEGPLLRSIAPTT